MANREHLAILKQGVEVWNEWREDNPTIRPVLPGANLIGANLANADFCAADLREAHLSRVTLRGANLNDANLHKADLSYANLSDTSFILAGLDFASLRHADLSRAYLRATKLYVADLTDANLREAHMILANLSHANLTRTNLEAASLHDAKFHHTGLDGAKFGSARMEKTSFSAVDLSSAIGLDTVQHVGPSSIGIDTLYLSEGKIPIEFLRGCGVPDDFIAFIPSHFGTQEMIQFYSCFISYSKEDEEFAKRLYSRMRDERLRVWFAPEHMKGGKLLHEQIEQAIQLHDRLLIVLSEDSMASEWVKREIRNARRAEKKENRRKLFPIRLVDFKTIENWKGFEGDGAEDLAFELGKFYIPDFSKWKSSHDAFEREFAKLLRDLRAEELK